METPARIVVNRITSSSSCLPILSSNLNLCTSSRIPSFPVSNFSRHHCDSDPWQVFTNGSFLHANCSNSFVSPRNSTIRGSFRCSASMSFQIPGFQFKLPFPNHSDLLNSSPKSENSHSSEANEFSNRSSDGNFHVWHHDFRKKYADGPSSTAVVLLGWLGAERKHLRRYADWYASRGILPITFVVPVMDLLGFDFGSRVEERVWGLGREIADWVNGKEEDETERCLMFHTFSNTGWLSYGIILEILQDQGELVNKIKGCVVDSGPDPELNPQVWASGFAAALLKKNSSLTQPAESNSNVALISNPSKNEKPFLESVLLGALENFFAVSFKLPIVNRKLVRIISTLTQNQPNCPQLYLYSSGDKVISHIAVERFMSEQIKLGKVVKSHDFVTSPHVDHFRTFRDIYSSELQSFLNLCFPTEHTQT